jgi:hypothetical protein
MRKKGVEWIYLAQDTDQLHLLVNSKESSGSVTYREYLT